MSFTTFIYENIEFKVRYDPLDASCLGAINEIAVRNDYKLDLFKDQVNKTFIDIGANLGIATIVMAKLNPESTVYSFEPYDKVYDMLLENIKLNELTNVKAYQMAVTKPGVDELKLSIYHDCTGANTVYADDNLFINTYQNTNFLSVKCISFDEIISQNNIDEILLLKIDCEGAEYDIFYTSEKIKEHIVKNVVGEFHDLEYNLTPRDQSGELINYCQQYVDGLVHVSTLII